jgi:fluoride exporter
MRSLLVVAVGGAVGASARWGVAELVTGTSHGFPWSTFVVNVVGCALIGLATRRLVRGSDAWLGVVVGVLGGFTTFSTFAVETRGLLDDGRGGTALLYVGASLIVGLLAVDLVRAEDGL